MQLIKICTSRTYRLISSRVLVKKTPVFWNERCGPMRYRKLVKLELERLAEKQIITKVFKCEWDCNIVNVMTLDFVATTHWR